MLQLQERLREAITLFDTHRNYRRGAQQERDARLGAAAAAAAASSGSGSTAGAARRRAAPPS